MFQDGSVRTILAGSQKAPSVQQAVWCVSWQQATDVSHTDSGMSEPILPFAAEITGEFNWYKIAFDELVPIPNLHHPAYFDDN